MGIHYYQSENPISTGNSLDCSIVLRACSLYLYVHARMYVCVKAHMSICIYEHIYEYVRVMYIRVHVYMTIVVPSR